MALGCAKVDPGPALQRTGEMIRERTGVQESYSPEQEASVGTKVQELLSDGLTLEDAVQIAFLNNREFQSLFYQIGASQADVVQATLLTNPSLSFLFRLPEGGGRPDLELSVGQELVDLWQIPVRKRIAKAALEQTLLRVSQRAIDLRLEVKTRYYDAIAAQRAQATARESVRLVDQALQIVEQQLRAGEVNRFDVLLERNTVIDVNLSVLDVERELRVAGVELARALGLSQAQEALPLSGELPSPVPIPGNAELVNIAVQQRFDLRLAAEEYERAKSQLKEQYLKVFPSIVAGFDVEQSEGRALPDRKILADTARESIAAGGLTAPPIESRAQRALERRQIIDAIMGPTIQLTLPIWDQNQAQIAKAGYRVEETRKLYEDLLNTVVGNVQRVAALARSAQQISEFYERQALPQANQNVEAATEVYRQGEQSIVALVEAQRSLVARRASYVNVLRSYAVALAELEAAVGGQLLTPPPTQPTATEPSR